MVAARDDPAKDAEIADLRGRLEAALGVLTATQREVVLLHDLDGWTHADIATAIGTSEGMSRQHLFNARRRLREALGQNTSREHAHGEEPLDLSPLDPTRGAAFDNRVAAIIREARVGAPVTVVDYLSRWTRPALAAAAVIAVLSGIPLLRQDAPPVGGTTAEILGVPPGLVAIARSTQAPGVTDLAEALGVEAGHGR